MHPDIEILRIYRQSDGLYTRIYDSNTFTSQLFGANDALRDPQPWPFT